MDFDSLHEEFDPRSVVKMGVRDVDVQETLEQRLASALIDYLNASVFSGERVSGVGFAKWLLED